MLIVIVIDDRVLQSATLPLPWGPTWWQRAGHRSGCARLDSAVANVAKAQRGTSLPGV